MINNFSFFNSLFFSSLLLIGFINIKKETNIDKNRTHIKIKNKYSNNKNTDIQFTPEKKYENSGIPFHNSEELLLTKLKSSIDNKTIGNTLGAAAGGVIGAQFGAGTGKLFMTAIGAGLGSLVGSEIADELSLDKVKKKCEELGFEENTSEFQNCVDTLE